MLKGASHILTKYQSIGYLLLTIFNKQSHAMQYENIRGAGCSFMSDLEDHVP